MNTSFVIALKLIIFEKKAKVLVVMGKPHL